MILENMEEKKRTAGLTAELENLKKELAMYQTTEEERWEKKKKEFLKSLKFYDLLGAHSGFLFDYGYKVS